MVPVLVQVPDHAGSHEGAGVLVPDRRADPAGEVGTERAVVRARTPSATASRGSKWNARRRDDPDFRICGCAGLRMRFVSSGTTIDGTCRTSSRSARSSHVVSNRAAGCQRVRVPLTNRSSRLLRNPFGPPASSGTDDLDRAKDRQIVSAAPAGYARRLPARSARGATMCRARCGRANSSGRRTAWRLRRRAGRRIQGGQVARRSASAIDAMGKSAEHVLDLARARIGFGQLDRNAAFEVQGSAD